MTFFEREAREVIGQILQRKKNARHTICLEADIRNQSEEFYNAPPGCPLRPFDVDTCLVKCRETPVRDRRRRLDVRAFHGHHVLHGRGVSDSSVESAISDLE
jgi:hypothetical protein